MIDFKRDVLYIQDFLFNGVIIEYDIRSAGLTMLRESQALPQEELDRLEQLPKNSRNVAIGLLSKEHPEIQEIISNGLKAARKNFVQENQLEEGEIICIKKDAIFTTRTCSKREFHGVQFREKTKWRSYLRLGKIEFFYQDVNRYQVLGLGTSSTDYHRNDWIHSIIVLMEKMSNADPSGKNYLMNLIHQYKLGNLDNRYYHVLKSDPSKEDDLYNWKEVIIPLVSCMTKVYN